MVRNIPVVAVIPAGRKRYLMMLLPYLFREVTNGVIDRIDLWLNTSDLDDQAYIYSLAEQFDFIRIVTLKKPSYEVKNLVARTHFIRHFFAHATDDVIYIRFDDDICYIEQTAIQNLIEFRLNHPEFFLVYPAIINSGRTAYLHQVMGLLPERLDKHHPVQYSDHMNLIKMDPSISQIIHEAFLDQLVGHQLNQLRFPKYIVNTYEKVPINCICWFGREFAKFSGIVGSDACTEEEVWLTSIKPRELGKPNCICGDSLMAHFAFHTQREHMESKTNLLRYYQLLSMANGDPDLAFSGL